MKNEILIDAKAVYKKFCRKLKRSLWYGVQDMAREVTFMSKSNLTLRPDEFWALKEINFSVRRGEMLGLIGSNGAGKSTLLKLLNGLIKPDHGSITMRGRVQAMIELGAGFNPILTGRENIYINASVLGITKEEVDRVLPEIIEFAGLEDFMDTPVKSYSSGMKARLGFAVISQLDPDVLLIDEVLAVGDTAFQEKCMRRMDALRSSNKAIIFVTHSLFQVEALCNRALWLDKGRIVKYGNANEVVRAYLDDQERRAMAESEKEGVAYQGRATTAARAYLQFQDEQKSQQPVAEVKEAKELIKVLKVELADSKGRVREEFPFFSDITVRIHYQAARRIERPLFNFYIRYKSRSFIGAQMLIDGYGPEWVEGRGMVECRLSRLPLTPKVYDIFLFIVGSDGVSNMNDWRSVAKFRITDENLDHVPLRGPMAVNHLRQGPVVYIPRTWYFYNGSTGKPIAVVESKDNGGLKPARKSRKTTRKKATKKKSTRKKVGKKKATAKKSVKKKVAAKKKTTAKKKVAAKKKTVSKKTTTKRKSAKKKAEIKKKTTRKKAAPRKRAAKKKTAAKKMTPARKRIAKKKTGMKRASG